ncbi:transcription factor BHLH148 isoform X1 [Ananas comosus]|uniref:Transcription factor BHLH148 isoform X1 n=1 Tax=Ananas comosus TaxID=4615 RepID=A0A6P5F1H4_ANACO|nr:transcription factor BHLH148 isoform X1 [Ananas comosus]
MLMDPFYSFQDELQFHGEMPLWALSPEVEAPFNLVGAGLDPIPVDPQPVKRSAFEKYVRPEFGWTTECSNSKSGNGSGSGSSSSSSGRNIHLRVIELLRSMPRGKEESKGVEWSRGFRHMMRERQRREKLSQSYADLHSILSTRSKGDKNSIVQSAALYIRELKGVRNELQRRNEEFKARLVGDDANVEGVKVKFEVANPSSTIDSMIGALRCLKNMDVKARAMRSNFSGHVLLTVMSIETKMSVSEVEKAIEGALANAETNKNQFPFHGSGGWALNSHVENMT